MRTEQEYRDLEAENASLRERLEKAEKDVERYRWLRDNNVGPSMIDKVCRDGNVDYMSLKCDEELDAAIDATIKVHKEGKSCSD